MDSLTFTISLKDLDACDNNFDQLVDDIQAFINILHHANPNYAEAGNILQTQLDEQAKKHKEETTDPREKFRERLDMLCPYDMETIPVTELKDLYAVLKSQIGEAMGPVCYTAHKLIRALKSHDCYADWVSAFVDYYEENWEF